jgi:hypothetical protein
MRKLRAPQGVSVVSRSGERYPVETYFDHVDEHSNFVWLTTTQPLPLGEVAAIHIDVLPARTVVAIGLREP